LRLYRDLAEGDSTLERSLHELIAPTGELRGPHEEGLEI
jgi:hypothetical protein